MKTYETTKTVQIAGGILQLTHEQAEPRQYKLEPLGDDLYRVMQIVEFKAGEVFGYDGKIDKSAVQTDADDLEDPLQDLSMGDPSETLADDTDDGVDIENVQAIEAGQVMEMLNMDFQEFRHKLNESYGVKITKKADEIDGDTFRRIAEDFNLGDPSETLADEEVAADAD